MAPALDDEVEAFENLGPHVTLLDREIRKTGDDVDHRKRLRGGADRRARGNDIRRKPIEDLELERQRAIGGARDLRFQVRKLVGGESDLAGEGLAVNESLLERLGQQLLAVLRGGLDEIAKHVIVLDFQRANA